MSHVARAVLLRVLDFLVSEASTVILETKGRSVLVVLGASEPAHLRSRHERFFSFLFLCWRAKVNAELGAHYSLNNRGPASCANSAVIRARL